MIRFKSNKDNPEYLIINDVRYNMMSLGHSQKLIGELLEEANKMFWSSYQFEKENGYAPVSEVAIKKDSAVGQYLLNNSDSEIINEDLYISEEDVKNALLIAIYDNNEISEKIAPLLRNQISGYKAELLAKYDEDVLDYILEHDNYEQHINPKEEESKEYIVFEDGEYSKKVLSTGKKVLEKKN